MSRGQRLAGYASASSYLAGLDDHDLRTLLDGAEPLGSGIGGVTARLAVDGVPVFVKRVPLTDLEREPGHEHSTANLFGLPPQYQYGIGSTGFGAWRELAAHLQTTRWVLDDECPAFPLLYHWRTSAEPPATEYEWQGEREERVERWDGSAAVRGRLEAIEKSSGSLLLFMECFPQTVGAWLSQQVALGDTAAADAITMVDRELGAAVGFMAARGWQHFDAHFDNILTDGRRLYLADFGLAAGAGFDLSEAEADFLARNRSYDRAYTATLFSNWLLRETCAAPGCDPFAGACPAGTHRVELPAAAMIIERDADVASVTNRFFREFQSGPKTLPFPADEVEQALAERDRRATT